VAVALVGRSEERGRIGAWLAGPPGVLLVSGEAGVGKTALIGAAVAGVAGARWSRGVPWQATPFAMLRQLVPGAAGPDALADLGGAALLVLDDLHWADDATLELLPRLAGTVPVIGAYRADELPRGHLLRRVRAQLRHGRRLTELALGPLAGDALRDLIAAHLDAPAAPALVAAVAERTEGLPFFVEEILASRGADGSFPLPPTVRDAVLLRAAALSGPAREALDLAAVLGVDFDPAVVAALTGGWPDELDHSGLVTDQHHFRHALTQEAVYSDIPWSRRRALHLAVAALLTEPSTVAHHLLAGGEQARARPFLVEAAMAHQRVHAYRDAAHLLRRALDLGPADRDIVDGLARCAELSGDHATAVRSLRELLALAVDDATRAGVGRRLAAAYEIQGHWALALAAREEATRRLADPGEAAAERLAIAVHLRSAASFRAALDTLDLAEAGATAAGRTDLTCRIGGLRGNVQARMGRGEEGLRTVRAALDLALRSGLSTVAAEIYQRLADSFEHAGDYRAAGHAYATAYEFCRVHAEAAAAQLCRACATIVLFQGGKWDQATKLGREVLADPAATPHALAVASGAVGLVHAMRGQVPAARTALLQSRATAGRIELTAMELLSTWGLALLDGAGAVESYRHVVRRCQETEERHYCVPVLMFAAGCFADAGATGDLGAVSALLADAAATTGQPEARAAFAYSLGVADPVAAQAVPHLRGALDLLGGLEAPLADTLVRHRLALRLAGPEAGDPRGEETGDPHREEAGELLRHAHGTARRLKARPLADRIATDLARIGGDRVDAPLTPREEQVLRLVGDGLTSREIGQRLFLSVRTVEMHVRNAVAKLGCRTRAEAVRRLG